MSPRDLELVGPRRATEDDIEDMNDLFSLSFTDRYRRDGLAGVRVPKLNPDIWRYAIRDAQDGAMLWFDGENELVAFNLAHRSGVEGWMGPLVVRPELQGRGVGKLIVSEAIGWLKGNGVTTIGLETMPRTVQNIGFYGTLGFVPQFLTISVARDVYAPEEQGYRLFSSQSAPERVVQVSECRDMIQQTLPGYDFSREYELTYDLGIGETILVDDATGCLGGICLCHSAPLADNKNHEELRVLKVFARSMDLFRRTIHAVEEFACDIGINQVSIRAQSAQSQPWTVLQEMGYGVRWTDLRMTLGGFAESPLEDGTVMFSNWEI
jgi:GNAT superfamily N-acetyltransferase